MYFKRFRYPIKKCCRIPIDVNSPAPSVHFSWKKSNSSSDDDEDDVKSIGERAPCRMISKTK